MKLDAYLRPWLYWKCHFFSINGEDYEYVKKGEKTVEKWGRTYRFIFPPGKKVVWDFSPKGFLSWMWIWSWDTVFFDERSDFPMNMETGESVVDTTMLQEIEKLRMDDLWAMDEFDILGWLKKNWVIVLIVLALIFLLPGLFHIWSQAILGG